MRVRVGRLWPGGRSGTILFYRFIQLCAGRTREVDQRFVLQRFYRKCVFLRQSYVFINEFSARSLRGYFSVFDLHRTFRFHLCQG